MPDKREYDDDWNWHAKQPKQNTAPHGFLPSKLSGICSSRKQRRNAFLRKLGQPISLIATLWRIRNTSVYSGLWYQNPLVANP